MNNTQRRRDFLKGAAALPVSALLAAPANRRLSEIGVIGGVPKEMAGDYKTALRKVAGMGYRVLEGGLQGASPQEYLKFLDGIGLRLVSCGVKLGKELAPDLLDTAVALKAQYATVFWPWYYPLEKLTMPQLEEIAGQANEVGRRCRAAGLKLALHNHDRDFRLLDGKPVFERLIEMTDPASVAIELDLYWLIKAGKDPLEFFRRYPGRFEIFHLKDMGPPPDGAIAVVGQGSIDFAKIFAHSEQAGAKHFIVEQQEIKTDLMKNLEDSFHHLSRLRY